MLDDGNGFERYLKGTFCEGMFIAGCKYWLQRASNVLQCGHGWSFVHNKEIRLPPIAHIFVRDVRRELP